MNPQPAASDAGSTTADRDQLRAKFRTEHPFCSAAEIWRVIDGEPALVRIECGTPTEHHSTVASDH